MMKKFISYIFLFSVLVSGAFSQSIKDLNLKEYELSHQNEKLFLNECSLDDNKYYNDGVNMLYLTDVEIYILGWSEDGKLAFLENRGIDGRGGNDLYFTILDLVNDKPAFSHNYYYYDETDNCTLEQFIKNNYKEIDKNLKKYGIKIQKTSYQPLPLKLNGSTYNFDITVKESGPGQYGFNEMIFFVDGTKNNTQKKRITTSAGLCNKALVTGYLKSPYENRIALIVAHSRYIFEGSEIFLNFYGCNLDKGFK